MDSKLITIAIHTYEKAQLLCSILESEGIPTTIQHINPEAVSLSAGVRVKINEVDLPRALRIVEDFDLMENYEKGKGTQKSTDPNVVLVPVDFSKSSIRVAEWAIHYAADVDAGVLLIHAYYSPFYVTSSPYIDGSLAPSVGPNLGSVSDYQAVEDEMNKIVSGLISRMDKDPGEADALPRVSLHSRILHGVPEDIIIDACRELRPGLLVIGAHNSLGAEDHGVEDGIIESVTAEVIDRCKVPILVVPQHTEALSLTEMHRVAFATSFAQTELVHFDAFMELMKHYNPTVHIFNISAHEDREVLKTKTEEIQAYFKRHYPHVNIEYNVIKEGDRLESVIDFIESQGIELVAIPVRKKGMITRFFKPSLPHRLLMKHAMPLMVFNDK